MAISLVGSPVENSAINGGNVTLTLPVGLIQNDVVYVFAGFVSTTSTDETALTTSSSGWTKFPTSSLEAVGPLRTRLFRKVMGLVPDVSIVVTTDTGDTGDSMAVVGYALRGVNTTTPEDATYTYAESTAGTGAPNSPSITTATNEAWVISFGAMNLSADSTVTCPSGYTNQVDRAASDTYQVTIGGATKLVASAGAENPGAWSSWTVGGDWAAWTVAVRPTSAVAYDLAVGAGSFTHSGTAASLEYGREVAGSSGSFAVTGTAAGLQLATILSVDAGSFAFTGKVINWDIFGGRGTFAVTGSTVALDSSQARVIVAGAGAFAVTGTAASLEYGFEIVPAAGSFGVTGTAASLEYGREVAAGVGSYTVTGGAADLFLTEEFEVSAQSGSFAVTGSSADLFYIEEFSMAAQNGSYTVTGTAVTLTEGTVGPVNVVAPVAYGPVTFLRSETIGTTEQIGAVLACTDGTWFTLFPPITFTYQWRRGGTNISGATLNAYTLEQADTGAAIDCVVTAAASGHTVTADSNNITCETESFTVRSHYRKVTGMHGGGTLTFTTTTEETP